MPTIDANGLRIGYDVAGAGPPLLLLHGATSTGGRDFAGQLPSLSRAFRCYTPDARGHGRTVNGFADLRFRYLYVGEQDVQWDHSMLVPAGLLYMHARHYSPEFGRFLQPDPADAETNLYGYVENSPASRVDPSGEFRKLCMCGGLGGRLDPRKLKSLVDGILRFVGGGKAPSFNGPNVTAYGGAAAAKRAARILHRVLRQGVERYHVFDTKYGSGVTYYLKNGWKVTWHNGSKSGGPAIEIYAGTVRMKVHFRK